MTATAKKPSEEQEPKVPTRAQADRARIDQREAAYREGFGARQQGEQRHENPHTRYSLAKQAAALRMYPEAAQERPYTPAEQEMWVNEWVPRRQAAKESWWDGWDTAERTAETRGEGYLRRCRHRRTWHRDGRCTLVPSPLEGPAPERLHPCRTGEVEAAEDGRGSALRGAGAVVN